MYWINLFSPPPLLTIAKEFSTAGRIGFIKNTVDEEGFVKLVNKVLFPPQKQAPKPSKVDARVINH